MVDPTLKSLMLLREDAHKRGMVDVGEALDHSLRRLWAEHVQRARDPYANPYQAGRQVSFPKWEGGNG